MAKQQFCSLVHHVSLQQYMLAMTAITLKEAMRTEMKFLRIVSTEWRLTYI